MPHYDILTLAKENPYCAENDIVEPILRDSAVCKAIALAGTQAALARDLGLDPSTVQGWTRIPLNHVLAIERLFPGEITRYEMRPDYWKEPEGEMSK